MYRLAVLLMLFSLITPAQAMQTHGACTGQTNGLLELNFIYEQDSGDGDKDSDDKQGDGEEDEPDCD